MKTEIESWLAVNHCLYLGLESWRHHFGDLAANTVLDNPELIIKSSLPNETKKRLLAPNWQEIESEVTWSLQENCHILSYFNYRYPPLLREIASPPLILYVKGDYAQLNNHQIAIVGSRKASINATQTATDFAKELAFAGFTITSGLALGVDAASHNGALQAGKPTIAVLGTGLSHLYPKTNLNLAAKICENGAIISEFPLNTLAKPQNFPRRNRIISGLSLATLVVEASLQSGSLITAKFALEQNRDVFAIPGSIHSPNNRGCHELIKQGAALAESPQDILQQLPLEAAFAVRHGKHEEKLRQDEVKLALSCANMLQYVEFDVTPVDVIIQKSGILAPVVMSALSELELFGYVQKVTGGYIRIARKA